MYAINPIFDKTKVQVDSPTCMYKMKPVYDELQSGGVSLSNGLDGAVSHQCHHKNRLSPVEIIQQIENVLKVLAPLHINNQMNIWMLTQSIDVYNQNTNNNKFS